MADDTESVLRLMTPKQAEVWRMSFLGYRQVEIAAKLGISQQAVARRVARGARRAKKMAELLRKCK